MNKQTSPYVLIAAIWGLLVFFTYYACLSSSHALTQRNALPISVLLSMAWHLPVLLVMAYGVYRTQQRRNREPTQ